MREAISINSGLLVLQKVGAWATRRQGARRGSCQEGAGFSWHHAACGAALSAACLSAAGGSAGEADLECMRSPACVPARDARAGDGGARPQQQPRRAHHRPRALQREPPHAAAAGAHHAGAGAAAVSPARASTGPAQAASEPSAGKAPPLPAAAHRQVSPSLHAAPVPPWLPSLAPTLTRSSPVRGPSLAQDSLGGNAYVAIVACVSGEAPDIEETLLTLKYAAGARRMQGAPALTRKVRARGAGRAGWRGQTSPSGALRGAKAGRRTRLLQGQGPTALVSLWLHRRSRARSECRRCAAACWHSSRAAPRRRPARRRHTWAPAEAQSRVRQRALARRLLRRAQRRARPD